MDSAIASVPSSDLRSSHWLTRFLILRLLGLVYAVAFLVASNQIVPLIGSNGLLPVGLYMDRVADALGSTGAGFARLPSLFWLGHSDAALVGWAWCGFALSCAVLAGFANALMMIALWALYLSYVHVGQVWYGYGWEIQLLETGFLAVFLCPLIDARPFPAREPTFVVIVLFRWLIFRIMLGAGLIKLRGDAVWRNLTALDFHFETQPLPGPLSRWFHFLPRVLLRAGVLFNHVTEVIAPWFAFWPRRLRLAAGSLFVLLQVVLIASGNLSFLNWLTLVPALACFDDAFWSRVLPRVLVRRAEKVRAEAVPSRSMRVAGWALAVLVAVFSIQPVINLVSSRQVMNTSFNPLDLVNTYGAFGSVGKERFNVVFEGTVDSSPDEAAHWIPYPYKGLPVDLYRRPSQVAPYQLRLDWQMWFASMAGPNDYPFTLNLVWKLLHNEPGVLGLFASNPFPGEPPRFVRASIYRYRFAEPGDSEGRWWIRERVGTWLPPLAADNIMLQEYLRAQGWL